MSEIKYLHIMTHSSPFNNGIINMINEEEGFLPQEHLFLIQNEKVFQDAQKYANVRFMPSMMWKNFKNLLNYEKQAKYVFLHQNWFYDFTRFLFTPLSIKRKYIWCVWGHDLYTNMGRPEGTREILKAILRKAGDFLINREIRFYKGIGIGFKYDALEIKKRFKDKIDIYMLPYLTDATTEMLNGIMSENTRKEGEPVRVMVGHSAHPYLNHKHVLNLLSKYKDENILISLVFAYGNANYARQIEEYAKSIFGEKVEVKKDRMPLEEYLRYLNSVDVAICDQIMQSGLGNIHHLMYLGKKIYLNGEGFLHQAFILEGLNIDATEKIERETFTEFIKENSHKERARNYAAYLSEHKNYVDMWLNTLETL